MANQAEPGTIGSTGPDSATELAAAQRSATMSHGTYPQHGAVSQVAGHAGPYPSFHGRTVSWVAVAIVMVGFLIGGFGLIFGTGGPIWWLFWTGVGIAVLGMLVAVVTNTFEDWY